MNKERDDLPNRGRLEGRYANYFKVGHNALEFVFDFGQFYTGSEMPHLHTRIITNPSYAKALLETLGRSVAQYERTFWEIQKEVDEEEGG
ncbi:MAG TPA: DUF3467 domain-containing protein [Pyrinomonadaceae bacterium]|nr:DUF3467 domain-containing protein [Pyrinomonadaceae bacterium]